MKTRYWCFLEPQDAEKIRQKSLDSGFPGGKGWLSFILSRIAKEDFIFLDKNTQNLFRLLNLKPIKIIERRT